MRVDEIYTGQLLEKEADTLVVANGNILKVSLYNKIKMNFANVKGLGDFIVSRAVEEAILEGFEHTDSI